MSEYIQEGFKDYFKEIQKSVHEAAKKKGWWDSDRNDSELLMLVVTEVAEACEALRLGNPPDDKIPQFSGLEAELADVIIRIMDMAGARNLRLAEAIICKIKMNESREIKHGGKKF